jgi:hypothetical protein
MVQVEAEKAKKKADTDTASSYDTVGSMDESHQGDDLDIPNTLAEDTTDPVIEKAVLELMDETLTTSEHQANNKHQSNMILAIAEMCRVAERSVMENIMQSSSVHGGLRGKQRKAKHFDVGSAFNKNSKGDTNNPISARFRLAASRIFSLSAINRGAAAADYLCDESMKAKCTKEEGEVSESPRTAAPCKLIALISLVDPSWLDPFRKIWKISSYR